VPRAASDSPRRLARAPGSPFCRSIPAASKPFDNDPAVCLSQSCCQDVQVMSADIIDPAMQPGNLGGALAVTP
jgi:hypothetical protein